MKNNYPIHECRGSEKVVRFVGFEELNEDTKNVIENGDLFGLYLSNGVVFAEDIWGDIRDALIK